MALSWPVDAPVTQQFGTNPNDIQPNGHTGIDFGVGIGTPVYSADSGTVVWADWAHLLSASNPWWIAPAFAGIVVVIDHNDGYLTLYAHLNETNLNPGDFVEKGVEIGKSGSTGLSTGPHLHFEVLGWPLQPYNGYYGRLNPNLYCGGLSFASSTATIAGNQRVVGEYGVKERTNASRSGAEGRTFTHGDVLTFKGYVRGEDVNGNNIWFVGGLSGTFFHSSAFDDGGTHDLQDLTPAPVVVAPKNRRIVGDAVVRYRTAPSTTAAIAGEFQPGQVFDTFTQFKHGESVNGNDIWFKGSLSGGYAWSGGFTNQGTEGLTEEAAPLAVTGSGRTTGPSPVRFRVAPYLNAELIDTLKADSYYPSFTSWVRGEAIEGNDIWFKGNVRGGYSWSGAFTDTSTTGLTQETAPAKPTEPAKEAYHFTPDFDFVEYIPAALPNFEFGNFPAKPEKVVIHQFGTPGVDTIGSTINTFTNPNMERVASAHFVVSGKRIVQMVSLNDRAYHAGPVGNNWVGIETDPAQDADTIASVNKLQKALAVKYGYTLQPIRHKEVPKAATSSETVNTSCGTLINLQNYLVSVPTPAPEPIPVPTPTPTPEPIPTPEPALDKRAIIAEFQRWQLEQFLKEN